MPDKQNSINSNNPNALLKALVMVSSCISCLQTTCLTTKFYCSVSFARQYITDYMDWAQHISEISSIDSKTLGVLRRNLVFASKCKKEVITQTKLWYALNSSM